MLVAVEVAHTYTHQHSEHSYLVVRILEYLMAQTHQSSLVVAVVLEVVLDIRVVVLVVRVL
jgi:hypothetical protein